MSSNCGLVGVRGLMVAISISLGIVMGSYLIPSLLALEEALDLLST